MFLVLICDYFKNLLPVRSRIENDAEKVPMFQTVFNAITLSCRQRNCTEVFPLQSLSDSMKLKVTRDVRRFAPPADRSGSRSKKCAPS